jgi:hypothetical protein
MKCWTRKSLGTSGSLERSEPAAETARTEPVHLTLWALAIGARPFSNSDVDSWEQSQ